MAQTPDETRREIEETRLKIAEAVEELEERIEERTNWRKFVARYPLETFAAAIGVGLVIGAALLFRPPARQRPSDSPPARRRNVMGILSFVRPIITPIITARLVDYMRRQRPKQ